MSRGWHTIFTLLNSGAADFVVTGCGTSEGTMLAANAMPGGGYPEHAAASEQRNAALLNKLKSVSHSDLKAILASEDPDVHEMVQAAFAGKRLELFKENCQCDEILKAVEDALK